MLSLPFTITHCITVPIWLMIQLSLTHRVPHVASLLSLTRLWLIVYHMWLDPDSWYVTCDMSVISDLMLVVLIVRYITCTTKTRDSPSRSSWLVIAVSLLVSSYFVWPPFIPGSCVRPDWTVPFTYQVGCVRKKSALAPRFRPKSGQCPTSVTMWVKLIVCHDTKGLD